MNSRVSFYTFGCRLNQAETASIARGFEQQGYDVVDFKEPADMVVVNTCTVTDNGDADTRKLVNKINRESPEARIALIGCQAQVQADSLSEMENVRWVVGTGEKMELPSIVAAEPEPDEVITRAGKIPRKPFTLPTTAVDHLHTRANLKIQDGCDNYCLFCVIPYSRGRARSRVYSDIIREATELVDAGHRELVITGVNIGRYDFENKTMQDVLNGVTDVDGLLRLRISSIEPNTIPADTLKMMMPEGKICRHLHVPIQSGHDEVLHKMNRRYTTAEYADYIHRCAAEVPGICLGTDIMVGYPTETEQHFAETVDLLKSLPLAYFHVFSYSEREKAKSHVFGPAVEIHEMRRRSKVLRDLSKEKRRAYMEQFIGEEVDVLVEQEKRGKWTGLTDNYLRVAFPAGRDLQNRVVTVKLTGIDRGSMTAELL